MLLKIDGQNSPVINDTCIFTELNYSTDDINNARFQYLSRMLLRKLHLPTVTSSSSTLTLHYRCYHSSLHSIVHLTAIRRHFYFLPLLHCTGPFAATEGEIKLNTESKRNNPPDQTHRATNRTREPV